jgi:hypothetical protein
VSPVTRRRVPLTSIAQAAPRSAYAERSVEIDSAVLPYRRQVYFACVVLALACNFVFGKDMAWDTLNYHLYVGFSAVNDRFAQDYFAAGPLSYFNPYAYIPFYEMVHAGLPAVVISSIFAAVHSIILWMTFELGVDVCPHSDVRTRMFAGVCAVSLAFMNPILMQQIGSCFADITTAELALGGFVILASAVRAPRIWRIISAGLILGAASALKLSNALHAIAAFAMLLMLPLPWSGRIRHCFIYGLSLGMGFVVVSAPWSYRLMRMFGNPMFPIFNNFFRSPEFTTETSTHLRFIPESFGQALWRPFAMIDPVTMVHEELSAPDPRYAILVLLSGLFVVRWLWRSTTSQPSSRTPPSRASSRILMALGCSLGVDWILWLHGSGNSRYFLTMACVAGVVVVGMLFYLFESRAKTRNYFLAIILMTQTVQLGMGAEFRWNAAPWGGPWFDVLVPEPLKSEPNLYLTLGAQSNSFIAPFLAKESGLINISGGYTLDPDGANGVRVKSLIRRYSPNLRVLIRGAKLYDSDEPRAPQRSEVDDALQYYGLRADAQDCATITVRGLPPDLEFRYETSVAAQPQSHDTTQLISCRLIPDTTDKSAVVARQHAVDLILDRLEDACPKLFQPRRLVTVHNGNAWRRLYSSTDITAWVSYGRVKFTNPIRAGKVIDVGSESDWEKGTHRLDCGSKNGVYFARVLE